MKKLINLAVVLVVIGVSLILSGVFEEGDNNEI